MHLMHIVILLLAVCHKTPKVVDNFYKTV